MLNITLARRQLHGCHLYKFLHDSTEKGLNIAAQEQKVNFINVGINILEQLEETDGGRQGCNASLSFSFDSCVLSGYRRHFEEGTGCKTPMLTLEDPVDEAELCKNVTSLQVIYRLAIALHCQDFVVAS